MFRNVGFLVDFLTTREKVFSIVQFVKLQLTQCLLKSWDHSRNRPGLVFPRFTPLRIILRPTPSIDLSLRICLCIHKKNQKDWDCNIPACRVVYLTAVHDATGSSPCFLVFGRRPRIAFEILLTLPAKLHEEDWNAYNVEQTCHLRRAYDMVTECDHFQRQKDVRL